MAKPASTDLRKRVVLAVLAGGGYRAVARRFDVAPSSPSKWTSHYRSTVSFESGKMGGHRRPLLELHEAWIKTNMAPSRGWSQRGERLVGYAPDGRWTTMTFLAALRVNVLSEPYIIDGPINGEIFRADIEQFLAPTLRPGDIVVLDNLGSHKSNAVRRTISNADARIAFLPLYSPDLNPIEQVFAKINHWMLMAQARTDLF